MADLFLHYVFDRWMQREYPHLPFERYADDVIVHCKAEAQAKEVLAAIDARMRQCKLELHPDKTVVVYCQDANRRATTGTRNSTFSAINLGSGKRKIGRDSISPVSARQSR